MIRLLKHDIQCTCTLDHTEYPTGMFHPSTMNVLTHKGGFNRDIDIKKQEFFLINFHFCHLSTINILEQPMSHQVY